MASFGWTFGTIGKVKTSTGPTVKVPFKRLGEGWYRYFQLIQRSQRNSRIYSRVCE